MDGTRIRENWPSAHPSKQEQCQNSRDQRSNPAYDCIRSLSGTSWSLISLSAHYFFRRASQSVPQKHGNIMTALSATKDFTTTLSSFSPWKTTWNGVKRLWLGGTSKGIGNYSLGIILNFIISRQVFGTVNETAPARPQALSMNDRLRLQRMKEREAASTSEDNGSEAQRNALEQIDPNSVWYFIYRSP